MAIFILQYCWLETVKAEFGESLLKKLIFELAYFFTFILFPPFISLFSILLGLDHHGVVSSPCGGNRVE